MMQIACGHLACRGNAGRCHIRIIEVRLDKIDDADAVRGAKRGAVGQRLLHIGVRGADEIENGHRYAAPGLRVQSLVTLAPIVAQQLRQEAAGGPHS